MKWAIIGIYLLNWYDVVITRIGLTRGYVEANPYMTGWVTTWAGAALKLAVVGVICAFWWHTYNRYPKLVGSVAAVALGGYLAGMVRNTLIVF